MCLYLQVSKITWAIFISDPTLKIGVIKSNNQTCENIALIKIYKVWDTQLEFKEIKPYFP